MASRGAKNKKKRAALGIVLRRLRMRVPDLTLEKVADEVGIDPMLLAKFEEGRWVVSDHLLQKICRVIGADLKEVKSIVDKAWGMSWEELQQKIREV